MNFSPRFVVVAACLLIGCLLPPASAQDPRQKVAPPAATPSVDTVIDMQGTVYGLAFGASEEEVIAKFGRPAGYIRLDAHRTALVYGRSHLLLCVDGAFDAVRIDQSVVDRAISTWMSEVPPFTANGWQLSNGIRSGMNRKQVLELVTVPPGERSYQMTFPADQCTVQLSFSHYTDRGEGDEAYTLYNLLVARRQDDKDNWTRPPGFITSSHAALSTVKGKKVVGMQLGESQAGVRVTMVYRNSPADKAGIRAGDLITRLNGEGVTGIKPIEFSRRMEGRDANELDVAAALDGKERHVRLERVDASTLSNELVGTRLELSEVKLGDVPPDFEAKAPDGEAGQAQRLEGDASVD